MNNVSLDILKNTFSKIATFIYETPLSIVATAVAGVASCIFAPSLTAPLLILIGTAMLTRVAVKVIERYNIELFIKTNEQMDNFESKYGSLYYIAFTATILVSAMIPTIGIALGVGIGIYKGMVVELQIQNIKQDTREQETTYSLFSPKSWLTRF